MRTYASDYSLDNYPQLAPIVKGIAAAAVAGVMAVCYATAGPGNAYAYSLALAQKPSTELPAMVVVGSRSDAGHSVASVSCSRGA